MSAKKPVKSNLYHYTCLYVETGEIFSTSGGRASFRRTIKQIDKNNAEYGYSTKKVFSKQKIFG